MISMKHFVGLVLSSLLLASCSPYPPGSNPNNPSEIPTAPREKSISELETELANRKAEEKRRADARKRAAQESSRNTASGTTTTTTPPVTGTDPVRTSPTTAPAPVKKTNYRTASPVPGKAGHVFNPWTNNAVDVRGVPSGSLVEDPNDPNKATHRFRVP